VGRTARLNGRKAARYYTEGTGGNSFADNQRNLTRSRYAREHRHGFLLTLVIAAPYLDYTFEVLEAQHGIEFYPVQLRAGERRVVNRKIEEPTKITCKTEEELLEGLAQILSSPSVRKVVTSLLAQSKA
jgi:hypothetical protein